METSATRYLATALNDDRIERRRLRGANDCGDIAGVVTIAGGRVVIEVKDHGGKVQVGPWLNEAEIERGNDDAVAGVVVFKRLGIGYERAGEHGVLMTLNTLCTLLQGGIQSDPIIVPDKHTQEP